MSCSTPKSSKNKSPWVQCDKCALTIVNKDSEAHLNDCPPDTKNLCYGFINNNVLYGKLDVKSNDEIRGLSQSQKDNLVFLSESAIKLCSLAIGEWAVLKLIDNSKPPVARIVWPTTEKSLCSVLLTKNGLELSLGSPAPVSVEKLSLNPSEAKNVCVVALNAPKSLDFTKDLSNRLHQHHKGRIITIGNKLSVLYYGKLLKFEIKSINKDETNTLEKEISMLNLDEVFYVVDDKSQFTLFSNEDLFKENVKKKKRKLLSKIGGLKNEIEEMKELIDITFSNSNKFTNLKRSHSVLLYGNSGTGKTLLAESVAESYDTKVISICAANLYSKGGSGVEETINSLFKEALDNSPSIVIIDNVDILCPSWNNRLTDTDKKISSTLLRNLENLNDSSIEVFVIATTNKLDAIDPVFRRCGLLDREIEIPTPTPRARKEILMKLLEDVPYDLDEVSLNEISLNCHGFVGADLVALCTRAALFANKRTDSAVRFEDFTMAMKLVRPSAMREVQVEVPNVKWTDIGGQDQLKLILKQAVEWPLKHPESFIRLGVTPPRGVLMFGPPGCSKTMIAKALATESGLNFLSIKGPELFSKWVGESERAVREVFRKARQVAPSIIFFDEIDALGGERSTSSSSTNVQERVLAQLLTELDGVTPLGDVTIVAATNRPDKIDKALLRPGRLDRIVYVPLPGEDTRREIFRIKLSKMPVIKVNLTDLVKSTEGYSGAEVNAVCHEAAMMALEESLDAEFIEDRHFQKALKLVTPRTPESLIRLYEDYLRINI